MPPDPNDFASRLAKATSGTGWRMSGKDSKAGLKATGGPRKGRSLAEITADVENEMAQEQSGLPIAGRSSLSRGAGPVSSMNGGESGIDWLKRNGPNRYKPTDGISQAAAATFDAAGINPSSSDPETDFPLKKPSITPPASPYMQPPQLGPNTGLSGMKPSQRMAGGVFPGRTIGQTNAMVASNFPIQPPKPLTPAAQPLEPLQPNGQARRRPKSSLIV